MEMFFHSLPHPCSFDAVYSSNANAAAKTRNTTSNGVKWSRSLSAEECHEQKTTRFSPSERTR